MIARAPGKLVVSGAYSVLAGAPSIVVAVDRYAVADTSHPPERVTDEVRAAIEAGEIKHAPWFDASALRARLADGRNVKLGLGSSAAILVASMAAAWAHEDRTLDNRELFAGALAAHREAQGGGSGIDVAASTFGGGLVCRLAPDGALRVEPHQLPTGASLSVFASPVSASTPELVGRVRAFSRAAPAAYADLLTEATSGAQRAATAATVAELLAGLRTQARALSALGDAAGAPIFTPDVVALARVADDEGAVFYPSGAGGGDVAIFAGERPPSERFHREAEALGRLHLDAALGALGVHLVSTSFPSATPALAV